MRYAARLLIKQPTFTTVVTLTLALGMGANTAMFSVVNGVLLRPLPYPKAGELAMVWENVNIPAYHNERNTPSPGNFHDWHTDNSVFTDMAAIAYRSWNLTTSEPVRVEGEAVSGSFFSVLRVAAELGRTFSPDDDVPGAPATVILGHNLWAERYGGDPRLIGQTIRLNDEPYNVIGVMPSSFRFPDPDDQLWVPIALTPQQLANHDSHFLRVVARLKPGVTVSRAQGDLETIARRLTERYPITNAGVGVRVISLRDQMVGDVRPALIVLFGVVGLLLLMVCANIGNLLLARASARGREFAIRAALGASRRRVAGQLLIESLLLAGIGGVLALAFGSWGIALLRWLAPSNLQEITAVDLDARVALFNAGVALVVGILCGMTPAFHANRGDLVQPLKDEGRAGTSGSGSVARSLLVVVETALGVIVLVGAGLLIRSFVRLENVPLGFRPDRVLTFRVILPASRYDTLAKRSSFYRRVAEKLDSLPGVRSAAAISFLPLTMAGRTSGVSLEGEPPPAPGLFRFADFRAVAPRYFETMNVPLVRGRDLAWSDTADQPPIAIVSQTAARTFWPNEDAVGKRLKLARPDSPEPWLTVVGVVGNVQQLDLVNQPRPAVYLPSTQDSPTGEVLRDWVVRASGDPAAQAAAARNAVWSIDRTLPVSRVQTMTNVRSASLAGGQFNVLIAGLFAALALVLSTVGLYGLTAFAVTQRTRELGIRVALGAGRSDVLKLVIATGLRPVISGLAIGFVVSFLLTGLMSALLFGIGSRDPLTFVAVGVLFVAVSLTACYIPALRATRLDPVRVLKA